MVQEFYKDYFRMTGEPYSKGIKCWVKLLYSHQIRFMKLWRKGKNSKFKFLYKARLKRYSLNYGIEISLDANLGEGIYLGHPYNITVAEGVTIGNNVNLHKGCTIGRENRGKRCGVPTLGDNVFVGINSTIVGNVQIGNDVMIAPNSFINFDVPDHSVVLGNPGRIVSKQNATEGYINFI